MSVKVSDVVATVSARACVCAVRVVEGGGTITKKKELVVCSMFDVINIVAINDHKWQYLHTVYLFRERAKSI